MDSYRRIALPRGLAVGTALAVALAWAPYLVSRGTGTGAPLVQTVLFLALFVLTVANPRLKVRLVRTVQRWVVNPVVRSLFALGLNPLGLVVLETRGRRSGLPRRTPVGNGRIGDDLWIIAEHGRRAHYVRNLEHDPTVRVRLRLGLRYVWVTGTATICPDDDPLARQRRIVRWHPLRALNAVNVRVLGADLLVVHVRLQLPGRTSAHRDLAAVG